jgi:hypothetical protein
MIPYRLAGGELTKGPIFVVKGDAAIFTGVQ